MTIRTKHRALLPLLETAQAAETGLEIVDAPDIRRKVVAIPLIEP